jgi:1-acyl-sn-glycerol-3-phosphate acyltransferase
MHFFTLFISFFFAAHAVFGLICCWAFLQGLKMVTESEKIKNNPALMKPEYSAFLRPSQNYFPYPVWIMMLRVFFLAPLGFFTICTNFTLMALLSNITGKSPLLIYPYIGFLTNLWLTVKFKQEGYSLDPRTRLLVANHSSVFDSHFVTLICQNFSVLVKTEVLKLPFLGPVARAMKCIGVDRSSEKSRSETQSKINDFLLTKNKNTPSSPSSSPLLLIYPEGTTNNHISMIPFKTGAFQLDDCPFQCVSIKYPNPHFSFSIATNQLVAFSFCYAVSGGEVVVHLSQVMQKKKEETPEECAERARKEIARSGNFKLDELGTFRAHDEITKLVYSNLFKKKQKIV